MKTKIALAAGVNKKTAAQVEKNRKSYMLEKFKTMFGRPENTNNNGGETSCSWNKSKIQLYLHADGSVGVYISLDESDIPRLEFEKISYSAAVKKLTSWAKKAEAVAAKRVKEATAEQAKAKAFGKAFAEL